MKTSAETRPITESTLGGDTSDREQPQLFLVIERSRPRAGGARHTLSNLDRVVIGRGSKRSARRSVVDGVRTLTLAVPDERMSSSHAFLERSGVGWVFVDAGSTNGSRVNRERVTRHAIDEGDLFELGQTFFRFRAAMPTPATAPGDLDFADLGGIQADFSTLVPRLARDLETLSRVARSEVSILLLGETGTGKEVLARAIHAASRRPGAFVAVNCGALSASLVESLLFGHRKGAFSGALRDEAGFIGEADRGTLFLDEIGELPLAAQVALLRVLQEREVVPVGATRPIAVDLRVVAATHRPLAALTQSGGFRTDLFARLAGFTYALPPLRDRKDDLGALVGSLLRRIAPEAASPLSLGAATTYSLFAHAWPLNVRELEQFLKVGVTLAENGRIEQTIPPRDAPPREAAVAPRAAPPPRLSAEDAALEAQLVAELKAHNGNVTRVGEAMGKARSQIQRWVKRLGIDPEKFRS